MDEFEQTVSSGSKRSRSRTSEVWNDFEILPLYEDDHRKVKCRKCTNILMVDKENGTNIIILLYYLAKWQSMQSLCCKY